MNSPGAVLYAYTNGRGEAGYFYINNSYNSDAALYARTIGSGNAVNGITIGTGEAGYFQIYNSTSSSAALYATTNGTGKAGYFDGDVYIEGDLTWKTKTSYLSVPAAAFMPVTNDDYNNDGSYVYKYGSTGCNNFCAPVHLPHGATVTKVTFYWYDNNTSYDGKVQLFRRYHSLSLNYKMAEVSSTGSSGNGSGYDDSISYATVDNSINAYFLYMYLSDGDVGDGSLRGCGVVIEYTTTEPQ